jgi:membrane associated rhomboid family serine protease
MFVLPLYDDNPVRRFPLVTVLIVAACIGVYLWQLGLGARGEAAFVYGYGMIPSVLFGVRELPPGLAAIPAPLTILSSMFLHGGFLHLAGNLLYLWIFGNNVEDSMGAGRFAVFYLLCGTAAALAQAFAAPLSDAPMVGASGAIGGVLGAYLVLHPRANVRVFVWILILIRLINVPAAIVLGVWFAGQVLSAATVPAGEGGVAVWAHLGGFAAGAILIPFFRRRAVPLFEPARSQAFAVTSARRGSVPPSGGRPWG